MDENNKRSFGIINGRSRKSTRPPTGLSCRPNLGRFINFARRTSFSDICQRLLAISFIVHPRSMASNRNVLTANAPPQRIGVKMFLEVENGL
jgi:hypothetical protein